MLTHQKPSKNITSKRIASELFNAPKIIKIGLRSSEISKIPEMFFFCWYKQIIMKKIRDLEFSNVVHTCRHCCCMGKIRWKKIWLALWTLFNDLWTLTGVVWISNWMKNTILGWRVKDLVLLTCARSGAILVRFWGDFWRGFRCRLRASYALKPSNFEKELYFGPDKHISETKGGRKNVENCSFVTNPSVVGDTWQVRRRPVDLLLQLRLWNASQRLEIELNGTRSSD